MNKAASPWTTQTRRGRWGVAALFLANGIAVGAWAPQVPLLLPRHGITESVLGLLILGLGVGAVAAMAFVARPIARYGSARVAGVFGLVLALSFPAMILAPTLWLLVPAMVAFGAVLGCMDVAMNANAVEVERSAGRAIMSQSHGFWSLGGFLGGASGGSAIEQLGREGQSMVAGLAILVLTAGALPLLLREKAVSQSAAMPSDAAVAGRGARPPGGFIVWIVGAMAFFCMVPEGAVLDWSALYLGRELGVGVATSGLAFAAYSATMAAMRFAGDGVRNRYGAVRTLRISGLIGAVGLAGAAMAPDAGLAIAGFAFAGLGIANMVPILFSAAGNLPGLSPGRGIAIVSTLGYSGILIAPSAIGFAVEAAGFRPIFLSIGTMLVLVAALAGRAVWADVRPPDEARPDEALPDAPRTRA